MIMFSMCQDRVLVFTFVEITFPNKSRVKLARPLRKQRSMDGSMALPGEHWRLLFFTCAQVLFSVCVCFLEHSVPW